MTASFLSKTQKLEKVCTIVILRLQDQRISGDALPSGEMDSARRLRTCILSVYGKQRSLLLAIELPREAGRGETRSCQPMRVDGFEGTEGRKRHAEII